MVIETAERKLTLDTRERQLVRHLVAKGFGMMSEEVIGLKDIELAEAAQARLEEASAVTRKILEMFK